MSEEIKTAEVLPHLESKCQNCAWYLGNHQCPAFELNIPDNIWFGEHNVVMDNQVVDLVYEENGPLI